MRSAITPLDLGAPASAYLEGLPQTLRGVTIRQLLTHMSGIPDINNAPRAMSGEASEAAVRAWVSATHVFRAQRTCAFSIPLENAPLLARLSASH